MFFESKFVYKMPVGPAPLSAAAKKAAEQKALKSAEVKINSLPKADKVLLKKYLLFQIKTKLDKFKQMSEASVIAVGTLGTGAITLKQKYPQDHQKMGTIALNFNNEELTVLKDKIYQVECKKISKRKLAKVAGGKLK